MAKPIDWLTLENEIRCVLRERNLDQSDKLICIDEILARHTRRGNTLPENLASNRKRLSMRFPALFDWENV